VAKGASLALRMVKEADAVLFEGFFPSHLLGTIEILLELFENR
jgi:hypothetical protein